MKTQPKPNMKKKPRQDELVLNKKPFGLEKPGNSQFSVVASVGAGGLRRLYV